jgi:hypothetical protein
VVFYLQMCKLYPEEPRYLPLVKGGRGDSDGRFSIGDDGHDDEDDLEAAKGGFGHVVSDNKPIEIER